jgi:hypothetical protein
MPCESFTGLRASIIDIIFNIERLTNFGGEEDNYAQRQHTTTT